MKQIEQDRKCYTCLGCNRLEDALFAGVRRCENYVKGGNASEEKSIERA